MMFLRIVWRLAALLVVLSVPARAQFSGGRAEAVQRSYQHNLAELGLQPDDLRVYSIGKSHIDAAFTWRLRETREHKVPYTFRQAIEHMRQYPTFTYHQSSAQFYDWVRQDDPALFAQIQEAVKQGRWVIVGGMWIEPDGNLPDGESLVRQFLYGQRFFRRYFDQTARLVWMEDSFGFNWNLPQIARKSGADSFYTYKMLWNVRNLFPFHLFQWQGPDGSTILAHISPILSIGNASLQSVFPYDEYRPNPHPDYFVNSLTTPVDYPWNVKMGFRETRRLLKPNQRFTANYRTTPREVQDHQSDELLPVVGTFYGAGDGGHGPTTNEINTQLALEQAGYAHLATTDQLFADLASQADRVPVWNDELYLEYHQGVLATHEKVKRQNRSAETRLRQVEAAAVAAHLVGTDYPAAAIEDLWKLTLLNQFHDILPGTGIREVYRDADAQYERIERSARDLLQGSLMALAAKIEFRKPREGLRPLVLFNPLVWERRDPASFDMSGVPVRMVDSDGREVPSQRARTEGGVETLYFLPGAVPSFGWKTLYLEPGEPSLEGGPEVRESAEAVEMENALVRLRIDRASGWLVSLVDKRSGRELLGAPSNRILAFHDRPGGYQAWNLSENYPDLPLEIPPASRITVTEQGPVLARVLIERSGRTSFKQWITLWRDSPRVDCVTWTDLHWKDVLVKVEFNTRLQTERIPAEIPYAVIERSTRPDVAWDRARTEMSCEKWIDLSDGAAGLGLLNLGKHGFSVTPDGGGFRISIIKSAIYPTPEITAKWVDLTPLILPNAQTDQGEHWARLALLPHPGDWRQGRLPRAGYEFNTPVLVQQAQPGSGTLPSEHSLISVTGESVLVGAIKRAEDDDGLIVRLVESHGKDTTAVVKVGAPYGIVKAWATDLLELHPRELSLEGGEVTAPLGHYEIKTVKLELDRRDSAQ